MDLDARALKQRGCVESAQDNWTALYFVRQRQRWAAWHV